MTEHTLEVLQFSRICGIVASYCVTDEGKNACLNKKPYTDIKQIENEKKYGNDFLALLNSYNAPPVKYRPPVLPFLNGIEVEGAALDIEGVYSVGLLAKAVCELHEWLNPFLQNEEYALNSIVNFIKAIPEMLELKHLIFAFIDENGEIQDLPSLRAIKNKIASIENDIEKTMRNFFTDEYTRSMLQSNLPTVKDGRQVIAVRSNFKGRIPGIIHEYSQSGQTFYLEPETVVLKNNDLLAAHAEYERELLRLLTELTAKIANHLKIIKKSCEAIIELDCFSAAARWARSQSCVFALPPAELLCGNSKYNLNNHGAPSFYLHQARHPLLGKNAVPIDLKLLKEDKVLIITGPNTGGKTVSLKTAALFALINQTGWPVPAGPQTRLPYFDFIACDIGDEQSLDQSLSTFSAHMKNVAEIIQRASEKSLVVLDELGSGTDPQEGCAIAMAVLDALIEKKSFVLVTTHHGALKNYGYSNPSCVNASVEFNEKTLSPTYKILMGVPGESHAVDIAKRNGLPETIVEKARFYLGNNRADVSDLIKGLIRKHEDLNEFETQKKEEERRLREDRRKSDLKELRLKQKELELRKDGIKKLDIFFEEKRKALENLVREIREGELTREKTLNVKNWIEDFKESLQSEHEAIKTEQEKIEEESRFSSAEKQENKNNQSQSLQLQRGIKVYIKNYKRSGEIIREEKKGKWLVAMDNLKITVPENDIEISEKQTDLKLSKPVITLISDSDSKPTMPSLELRLLGMRGEEAQKALQLQMDTALVHGVTEFAIIHGKGDGILQHITHNFLKSNNYVKNFRFAKPEEGGSGKTIVNLE
ncbi:endonuclease MutS2 [Treponema pedis]|nr:endonuclease MutS2 [Treponema pedis]